MFNVAGIIRLQSPVIIRAPYITIAGQSAPGDGVCIAGETIWVNTHDVIIGIYDSGVVKPGGTKRRHYWW